MAAKPASERTAEAAAKGLVTYATYYGLEATILVMMARGMEIALMANIARLVGRYLNLTDFSLGQFVLSTTGIALARRIVRRIRLKRQAAAARAILAGYTTGVRTVVNAGLNVAVKTTLQRVESKAAMEALSRALADRLALTDVQVLRATDDIFRRTIGEVALHGLADGQTRREVAQAALDRFTANGITGFVDRSGRQWNLASYTEMATRTALHNAERQGVADAARAAGHDLVTISGSPGACPLCTPFEGEVLSLDGLTPGYITLAEAEAQGLFHPNCRHVLAPYVEGLTRLDNVQQGDPERYEAEEEQRRLERGVRHWKRREVTALDPTRAAEARAKVRAWQGRLRQHVADHDLPRLRYREQITKAI